jgi:hypothetical protein
MPHLHARPGSDRTFDRIGSERWTAQSGLNLTQRPGAWFDRRIGSIQNLICAYIVVTVLAVVAVMAAKPGIIALWVIAGVMLAKDAVMAGMLVWRWRVTATARLTGA